MNANRRKQIAHIISSIRAELGTLEEVRGEEQEAFDNMPESLQTGSGGEAAEQAIAAMDTALDEINSAIDDLEGEIV